MVTYGHCNRHSGKCDTQSVGEPWRSLKDAFEDHRAARDHRATALVIEFLKAFPQEDPLLADELTQSRSAALHECQDALRRDWDFGKELENATSQGLIREEERARHDATIASIESSLTEIEGFGVEHAKLAEIAVVMEQKRQGAVEEARSWLDGSKIAADHPDRSRIEQLLGRGDVLAANEYIQALIDGQPLPLNREQRDHFVEFFPDASRQLEVTLTKRAERPEFQIVAKVRKSESLPGLNMSGVPGGAASGRNARSLVHRQETKAYHRVTSQNDLETLGFKIQRVEIKKGRSTNSGRGWYRPSA